MINYNFLQKYLHSFVLGNKFIKNGLYELEKLFFLKKINISNNNHIFVTGLPRSGTTMLLNFIYSSGEFASLKYLNMPFILSPNISNLIPKKNMPKKERYHNDGIMFDLNSPESFDEVFFSNFSDDEIIKELHNFVSLILTSQNKNKYLSKNNLNYKRIELIKSIFPESIFLIPIREPLQHSKSLFNQHLHFSKLQKNHSFIRKYMGYLKHYEFGLDHKFWNSPNEFKNPNNLDYWIEQWIFFYEKIYLQYRNNKSCKILIYENLCKNENIPELLNHIKIKVKTNFEFKLKDKININIDYNKKLYTKALELYSKFQTL